MDEREEFRLVGGKVGRRRMEREWEGHRIRGGTKGTKRNRDTNGR